MKVPNQSKLPIQLLDHPSSVLETSPCAMDLKWDGTTLIPVISRSFSHCSISWVPATADLFLRTWWNADVGWCHLWLLVAIAQRLPSCLTTPDWIPDNIPNRWGPKHDQRFVVKNHTMSLKHDLACSIIINHRSTTTRCCRVPGSQVAAPAHHPMFKMT